MEAGLLSNVSRARLQTAEALGTYAYCLQSGAAV